MITVAEIMTTAPITAEPDMPLGQIIGLMKEHHCRQIPILHSGRLIGIITDRDTRLAMNSPITLHERASDQFVLSQIKAEACMTRDPLTVTPDTPAIEAADLMKTYKFGGLPVVAEGRLVGIITVSDILTHYMKLLSERG
ncbi:MAG: CBS domain-containing protein [Anaerolineae bacterium]|nr:CBS domain-containing protein [Anaerolineae bacterium]